MTLISKETFLNGLYNINRFISYVPVFSALTALFDQCILKPIFTRCHVDKNEHKYFKLVLGKDGWSNGKLLCPIWNIFESRVLFSKKQSSSTQIFKNNDVKTPEKTESSTQIFKKNDVKTPEKAESLNEYKKDKNSLSKELAEFLWTDQKYEKNKNQNFVKGNINQYFEVEKKNPGISACTSIALCGTIKLLCQDDFESINAEMLDEIVRKGAKVHCFEEKVENWNFFGRLEKSDGAKGIGGAMEKFIDLGVFKKTLTSESKDKPYCIQLTNKSNTNFDFERPIFAKLDEKAKNICETDVGTYINQIIPHVFERYFYINPLRMKTNQQMGMVITVGPLSISMVVKPQKNEIWLFDSHGKPQTDRKAFAKKLNMKNLSLNDLAEEIKEATSGKDGDLLSIRVFF